LKNKYSVDSDKRDYDFETILYGTNAYRIRWKCMLLCSYYTEAKDRIKEKKN